MAASRRAGRAVGLNRRHDFSTCSDSQSVGTEHPTVVDVELEVVGAWVGESEGQKGAFNSDGHEGQYFLFAIFKLEYNCF